MPDKEVFIKRSTALFWLSLLIAALMLMTSAVGLFRRDLGTPFSFTTLRGENVEMYGQGLYRFETLRDGTGNKGSDAYILLVAVPLLVLSAAIYRRGSLRAGMLLSGTLAYFLYLTASMTFGYAYNNLFLLYLAAFSASLFGTAVAITCFDLPALRDHFSNRLPRRGIAAFLFAVGGSLILVWAGLDILPALIQGKAPALSGHTTLPTHALDMGIIAPLAIVAGVLLLRRVPLGYLLASILLVVSAVLGAGVLALSAAQLLAHVLTVPETIGFVVPFAVLTLFALGLAVRLFRNLSEEPIA